jgi:hypothetical protein
MKTFRILAIIPLALMSLMNVGYPFGTDPKPDTALAIAVAALAVAGVNVVAAVVALANDAEGAMIGLAVSAVALLATLAAGSRTRNASVA